MQKGPSGCKHALLAKQGLQTNCTGGYSSSGEAIPHRGGSHKKKATHGLPPRLIRSLTPALRSADLGRPKHATRFLPQKRVQTGRDQRGVLRAGVGRGGLLCLGRRQLFVSLEFLHSCLS